MSHHYSDPSREADPFSAPDIEVWNDYTVFFECGCGEEWQTCASDCMFDGGLKRCPHCGEPTLGDRRDAQETGYWGWYCSPQGSPEGPTEGPFPSIEAALKELRACCD